MKVKTYKFSRGLPIFYKPNCTRDAVLSLQFIKNEYSDEPTFRITVNNFEWKKWNRGFNVNPVHFGYGLANCKHMSRDSHKFLRKMFEYYIRSRDEQCKE